MSPCLFLFPFSFLSHRWGKTPLRWHNRISLTPLPHPKVPMERPSRCPRDGMGKGIRHLSVQRPSRPKSFNRSSPRWIRHSSRDSFSGGREEGNKRGCRRFSVKQGRGESVFTTRMLQGGAHPVAKRAPFWQKDCKGLWIGKF